MLVYFALPPPYPARHREPPGLEEWGLGRAEPCGGDCLVDVPEPCVLQGAFFLPGNAFLSAQLSKAAPGPDSSLGPPSSLGCFREGRRALLAQGCLS